MIKYEPSKLLKKIASERKIKKLLKANVSLKRTALSFVNDLDFLNKKAIEQVALKVIKSYKERIAKAVVDADYDKSAGAELKAEILADPAQLIQRVQNEIAFQVHNEIKDKYAGERATWLPSSAVEPRPEHQLNYGKSYIIGEGIDGVEPGDEYGCQCGVEVETNDSSLNL